MTVTVKVYRKYVLYIVDEECELIYFPSCITCILNYIW